MNKIIEALDHFYTENNFFNTDLRYLLPQVRCHIVKVQHKYIELLEEYYGDANYNIKKMGDGDIFTTYLIHSIGSIPDFFGIPILVIYNREITLYSNTWDREKSTYCQ